MAVRNIRITGGNGIGYTNECDSPADYASIANDTYFKDLSLGVGGLILYKDLNGDVKTLFNSSEQNAYITDLPTMALLSNTSNWTNGIYTGTVITGTYAGQKHFDDTYLYEAITDNYWVRLLRVLPATGGHINPMKFYVDQAYIGFEAEGLTQNIYTTIESAGIAANTYSSTNNKKSLVVIRPGVYTETTVNLRNLVDFYCEPGSVFTTLFRDNGVTLTSSVFGYGKWVGNSSVIDTTGVGSVVTFECDYINVDNRVFSGNPGTGGSVNSVLNIKANWIFASGYNNGYAGTLRGKIDMNLNVSQYFSSYHALLDTRGSFSGTVTWYCPRLILAEGTIYGGNFTQVFSLQASGIFYINGDLISQKTANLGGVNIGMLRFHTSTSGMEFYLKGNIYAGFTPCINVTTSINKLVIEGNVTGKSGIIAALQASGKYVFRKGVLKSEVGGGVVIYASGGSSCITYLDGVTINNDNVNGSAIQIPNTTTKVRVSNCVSNVDVTGTGYFATADNVGTTIQINNTRANKGLNTNLVDALTPSGLIVDALLETYNL